MSDTTQFETSLDIGPDITPRIGITDKGYDSRANRVAARARGVTPVIPRKENSKERGRFFPKQLYKLRARIEQTIGKLKRFKRVALRCEKTGVSYDAIVSFACGLILVKSVHTAYGGPFGLRLTLAHPERTQRLIIWNAVGHEVGLGARVWTPRRAYWAGRAKF